MLSCSTFKKMPKQYFLLSNVYFYNAMHRTNTDIFINKKWKHLLRITSWLVYDSNDPDLTKKYDFIVHIYVICPHNTKMCEFSEKPLARDCESSLSLLMGISCKKSNFWKYCLILSGIKSLREIQCVILDHSLKLISVNYILFLEVLSSLKVSFWPQRLSWKCYPI